MLSGFSLNKDSYFSSIVRTPISWSIERELKRATVNISVTRSDITLINSDRFPFYRFILVMGMVSDIVFDQEKNLYRAINEDHHEKYTAFTTEWLNTQKTILEQNIVLSLNSTESPVKDSDTLLLGIGIEFGFTGASDKVENSKGFGCARILGLG